MMQGSSSDLRFDSKEFDYPLDHCSENTYSQVQKNERRSVLKKAGQSRASCHSSVMLKVHFRDVLVREYAMVLGDNPAVSHGAPVQLEWEPQEIHDVVHIDNYEKARSLWRAKDRRGFLLNAHKRVKILFAAGYTIDEIAKATMEMKESRTLRAESLKSQGMINNAISALLSGAAETTGRTVRGVQVLPTAIAGAGKVMVHGTSKAVVGVGTEMMGLTNRVVASTTSAVKQSSQMVVSGVNTTGRVMTGAVTGTVTGVTKGTGKVVTGTSNLLMKGTTGVVKGTTGLVKGTGNVMMGSTKAVVKGTTGVVKGTGVLFVGTSRAGLGMLKDSSKRLSRIVSGGLEGSSHHTHSSGSSGSKRSGMTTWKRHGMTMDDSNSSSRSASKRIIDKIKSDHKPMKDNSDHAMPKPTTSLTRQRSLDSAQAERSKQLESEDDLQEELECMQDFLIHLEGVDKTKVQDLWKEEKEGVRRQTSGPGSVFKGNMQPSPPTKKRPMKSPESVLHGSSMH